MSRWWCCCPEEPPETPECFLCNFGPNDCVIPQEWTVDLGIGGWIDGSCNQCDQIAGQYVVSHNPLGSCRTYSVPFDCSAFCRWEYSYDNLCYTGVVFGWADLYLFLSITDVAFDTWKYRLRVILVTSLVTLSVADYESSVGTDLNCLSVASESGKIALTKIAESHAYGGCTGALPETIEVWPNDWP